MTKLFSVLSALVCAVSLAPVAQTASVSVRVQNALNGEPVADVTVFCVESDSAVTTGADGHTSVFSVPFRPSAYESTGTVTLVLLAEGFLPCVCTVVTLPRKLRSGVALSVYPDDGSLSEVTSVVEALPQEALRALVEQARSKQAQG